jgi:hypothetical protein
MELVGPCQHALRHQMAAADHQGVARQIQLLDRQGQQRQVLLHMAHPPGEALNEAGANRTSTQPAARPLTLSIHQSKQLRGFAQPLEEPIQLLDHLLAAPHRARREPLMHQRDPLRKVCHGWPRGHRSAP